MTKEERKHLLSIFNHMKSRCYRTSDKYYRLYGGKGITICDEWLNDKNAFLRWAEQNNYKQGLSIERYDNAKGYNPTNCCFIPLSEQPKNTSRNVFVEYNNEIIIVSEVARREGVSPEAIRKRVKRGWYKVVENPNRLRQNPTPLP